MTIRNLIILLLICFSTILSAQQKEGYFYNLTQKNGLSSNQIVACIQDAEGFYWIATKDGLNRFNGSTCLIFRNKKDDSTSLSNNYCTAVLEDENGNIWVGTLQGLNRYNKKENTFRRYFFEHPLHSFDKSNAINSLQKDNEGNIWVSSYGLRKLSIKTDKWTYYFNNFQENNSIPEGIISHLQFDKKNNRLWMLSGRYCIYLDLRSNIFYHLGNNPDKNSLLQIDLDANPFIVDENNNIWFFLHRTERNIGVYSISENKIQMLPFIILEDFRNLEKDNLGRIWINYWWSGTEIYDPRNNKLYKGFLEKYHSNSALSKSSCELYVDRTGIFWIGSDKGMSIYNPKDQYVRHYSIFENRESTKFGGFTIHAIVEQGNNTLWVGSNEGLFKYEVDKAITTKMKLPFSPIPTVHTLTLFHDSILWLGKNSSILLFDIKKEKVIRKIDRKFNAQFIYPLAADSILAGYWNDGINVFSPDGVEKSSISPFNSYQSILYDKNLLSIGKSSADSLVWIGYNGGNGFSSINTKKKSARHYKIKTGRANETASNTINVIYENSKGDLWLGTFGNGLFYFNRQQNTFTNYSQNEGLKGNFVNSILADKHSNLWVSTNNGISIVDSRSNRIINSGVDLQFDTHDFFGNGQVRKNGHLLFFAGNKIVELDPAAYPMSSRSSKILLSAFKVFEDEVRLFNLNLPGSKIKLSHRDNFFSIEYSQLKPDPNSTTNYAFILEGFDNQWHEVKGNRIAHYTKVPPGKYVFKVKATDISGDWKCFSNPLSIIIIPPFYARWWFITLMAGLFVSLVWFFYRYRITQLKNIIRVRSEISQDLHDEVASTLSGIKLYSELAKGQLLKNKNEKVMESLEVISVNASETKDKMSDIIWAVNPMDDSFSTLIKKIKIYAEQVTQAAGVKFTLEYDKKIIDEKLNMQKRKNIYLICKESVNNAVKYSGASMLLLSFQKSERMLQIKIKDDGNGFDTTKKYDSNGLYNMERRAEEIKAVIKVHSGIGNGTEITVNLKM